LISAELFPLKIIYLFKSQLQAAAASTYGYITGGKTTLRPIYKNDVGLAFLSSNAISTVDTCCCRWQEDTIFSIEIASSEENELLSLV
jgi:hypothetical protein